MRFELFIASRYLRAKRRQAFIGVITGISIAGVAAGVASLVIALAVNNGFREDLQDRLIGSTSHVDLMRVKDDAQAVALMNDSRYGLTASVWTSDVDAAVQIGSRIESGTWFMNRCDYVDPALPWTGIKDSGHGCSLSRRGYASLTRPKSFHLRLSL